MLRLLAFVGFFTVTLLCVIFSNREMARVVFLLTLFVPMIYCGVLGVTFWPMNDWHLYGSEVPQSQTYYEFRVSDGDAELKYDARAAPPAIPTQITRYAERSANQYSSEQQHRLGCYFLDRAREYRKRVGSRPLSRYLRFPPHQYGYRWTSSKLEGVEELTELRVYRVDQRLTKNGTDVHEKTETKVHTVNITSCS